MTVAKPKLAAVLVVAGLLLSACNDDDAADVPPEDAPAEDTPDNDTADDETGEDTDDEPRGELSEVPDHEPNDAEELIEEEAGTALARCDGGQAELVWWVPAEGWTVDDVDAGPEDDVDVEFERNGEDVEFEVRCVDDQPEVQIDS